MPVNKISSSDVELGMYVAKLDRPWSETPFLFQGFEVKTEDEITELQRQSNDVYIMVPDEIIDIKKPVSSQDSSIHSSGILHKISYENKVAAEKEIIAVRRAHENIALLVTEIESLIKNEELFRIDNIEKPVEAMVSSIVSNPDAYLWLTRIRKFDSFIYKDSLSCAVWATALGRKMGMEEKDLKTLATGCMLMDVGKLMLPEELLHKQDRLENDEWSQIKSHVELGLSILEAEQSSTPEILDIVRTHHERLDGSGYPNGLHGNQIPLFGQIAGIVDFYVAVTMPRPFAKVLSPSQAEQMLFEQKDKYFNEILVDYFIQTLSAYPTGSLVELNTGEVAIVMAQNDNLHLKPDVVLLLNKDKQPALVNTIIRLATYCRDDQPVVISRTLKDGDYGINIDEISFTA